ncbi:MAG: selenide, water dikinase SelD [Casimicrobiaceae bacterium]
MNETLSTAAPIVPIAPIAPPSARLTSMSHGGGCGCKIAPAVLREILARAAPGLVPPALIVGIETSDDAAVYRINDTQAIVATTDFFMPIVDDPHDFGAIAATNAISDIYAMGATPLFALALVAMPVDKLPVDVIRAILDGGESACRRAGIPIVGGHTIDSVEPIYGLVVIGIADPRNIKRNAGAQAGDVLLLGKPLGVGIYSAALKKGTLAAAEYRTMVDNATQLNTPGVALGAMDGVHALTDVTGFGLAGHLLEICRASGVRAMLDWPRVPLFADAASLAAGGCVTGASARNWTSAGADITLSVSLPASAQALLTDPQTSGGLLVAVAPQAADAVLHVFRSEGFLHACAIGRFDAGAAHVDVR